MPDLCWPPLLCTTMRFMGLVCTGYNATTTTSMVGEVVVGDGLVVQEGLVVEEGLVLEEGRVVEEGKCSLDYLCLFLLAGRKRHNKSKTHPGHIVA